MLHFFEIILSHLGHLDFFVSGGNGDFLVVEHFFVEFLAVAQPCVFYLDVLCTTELDHALGQIGNLHGSSHVEYEYLSALAHRAGFEHQLAGFRDEHEVADDVGMGHRDGPAVLDLFAEKGNHRTAGAEHVAEASGHKLRLSLMASFLDGLVETLHIDFADAFRTAHHVRRIHGLVGADHHELLHAVFHGQVGHDLRAFHVVLNALAGIVLHHRHMLVGGGVEHVVGTVFSEDGFHVALVADGGHDGIGLDFRELAGHHQATVVLRCLCLVYQYQLVRSELGNLLHDLAADATRRTGYQDALVLEQCLDGREVNLYLVAGQQVLDFNLPELGRGDVALAVPFHGGVHGIDGDAVLDEQVHHLGILHEFLLFQRRHEERIGVLKLHLSDNLVVVLIHLHAHQPLADHVVGIADESLQLERGVVG